MNRASHIVSFDDVQAQSRTRTKAGQGSPASSRRSSSSSSQTSSRSTRSRGGAGNAQAASQRNSRQKSSGSKKAAPSSQRTQRGSSSAAGRSAGRKATSRSASRSASAQGPKTSRNAAEETTSRSFIDELVAQREKRKKAGAKAKADKQFDRAYAAEPAAPTEGAPRAAVYEGQMGRSHKKASRMQGSSAGRSGTSALTKAKRPFSGLRAHGLRLAVVAACLVGACLFLYSPAQQCYQELRERDRLQLEYDTVVARNEALASSVDYLKSSEGIEDAARMQFGWVMPGENPVNVSGIETEEASGFQANIVSSDIEPPDTWYSGVLDPLFGVE